MWRRALSSSPLFALVANGDTGLDAIPQRLRPYRYLLSPTLDSAQFDAAYLHDQLQQRLEDLASPAATLLKPLLARDPTGEILILAQRWTPAHTPRLCNGVWCDKNGNTLFNPGDSPTPVVPLSRDGH